MYITIHHALTPCTLVLFKSCTYMLAALRQRLFKIKLKTEKPKNNLLKKLLVRILWVEM